MKKLGLLLTLSLLFNSCSKNDEENQTYGHFKVGDVIYNVTYAYINDENTLNDRPSDLAFILSNKDLTPDNISSGINIIYVDYRGIDFEAGSKDLLDYRITKDASRVNGLINGGNKLLDNSFNSNLDAIQKDFVVNSISSTEIDIQFSFTREDGVLITGGYIGNFTNVSN